MTLEPVGGRPYAGGFEVQLVLPSLYSPTDQTGTLEDREMLRDLRRRFGQWCSERTDGLVTQLAEPRKELPAGRMAQCEEDLVELCFAPSSTRTITPLLGGLTS